MRDTHKEFLVLYYKHMVVAAFVVWIIVLSIAAYFLGWYNLLFQLAWPQGQRTVTVPVNVTIPGLEITRNITVADCAFRLLPRRKNQRLTLGSMPSFLVQMEGCAKEAEVEYRLLAPLTEKILRAETMNVSTGEPRSFSLGTVKRENHGQRLFVVLKVGEDEFIAKYGLHVIFAPDIKRLGHIPYEGDSTFGYMLNVIV